MGDKVRLLCEAATYGDYSLVYRLISKNVDVNGKDINGWRAIHNAALNGHIEIVQLLLKTQKVSVDSLNDNNETALHLAVWNKQFSTIEFFVRKSANCNLRNKFGQTPLHVAFSQFLYCCEKKNDCGRELEKKSAAIYRSFKNLSDTITGKCVYFAIAAFLVTESNADLSIKNYDDETPLDLIPDNYIEKEKLTNYFNTLRRKGTPINKSRNYELSDPVPRSTLDITRIQDNIGTQVIEEKEKVIQNLISTIDGMKSSVAEVEHRCKEIEKVFEKKICELQCMLKESIKISESLQSRIQSLESHFLCHVCHERQIRYKLLCGHQFCNECYEKYHCCNVCDRSDS